MRASKVSAALTAKGFQKVDRDHHFFFLYVDGKKSGIFTKISHSANKLGQFDCDRMAKQIKLSRGQFEELIDCSLSGTEYLGVLRKAGDLPK